MYIGDKWRLSPHREDAKHKRIACRLMVGKAKRRCYKHSGHGVIGFEEQGFRLTCCEAFLVSIREENTGLR
ncbi:hypothetical protein DRO47_01530 [Candidatus Bathyarchaeota archaeon]|nr:MAG: hypothetical protein DRO47_01530 [Candidatus Bathyarchaeota archaeon]